MKRVAAILTGLSLAFAMGEVAFAQAKKTAAPTKKNATKAQSTKAQAPATPVALTPGKSSFLSTPTIRKPATLDPNSAVEVRGQARTLSMMLVLKNGKDSINFIKVRKDYRPEIPTTDY